MKDSNFDQYKKLLQVLTRLDAVEQIDGKEADDLREKMDLLWYKLTDVQQDELRQLSMMK